MRKILAVALLAAFAPLGIAHAATPKSAPAKPAMSKPVAKPMAGKMTGHKMAPKKSTTKKITPVSAKAPKKLPARDPKTGRFMKSATTAPKTTKK
ncbi:hypothetical protein EON83_23365 [bacterium]|nr:MAG: hypothetical protein EON83_23365 [bacterium]